MEAKEEVLEAHSRGEAEREKPKKEKRKQKKSVAPAPSPQNKEEGGSSTVGLILRVVFILFVAQFVLNSFTGPKHQGAPKHDANGQLLNPHAVIFQRGDLIDVHGFLSEDKVFRPVGQELEFFVERDVVYDVGSKHARRIEKTVDFSENVQGNGSLYLHVYVTRAGQPVQDEVAPHLVSYDRRMLTEFRPAPVIDERKNLLSGEAVLSPEEIEKLKSLAGKWVPFWCPEVSIQLVLDTNRYRAIPEDVLPFYEPRLNADGTMKPIVFFNTFWKLSSWCKRVNDSTSSMDVQIDIDTTQLWKFRLYTSMEKSMEMQSQFGAGQTVEELDEVKRMMLETNPWLLGITAVVTILHTIFDMLAFKNEIAFWRGKQNLAGLSVRTLIMNAVSQLVIFLYLLDNQTSWMIIISAGIGTLIDFWKITKGMIVTVDRSGSFPRLRFRDRESYANKTKEYDEQAMRYLGYALYPLLVIYAIYSLYTENHKSWYSWILSSATGFVYTFGFIRMCPQLFINYKMKSVAAMPWRAFTYKTLSTFIDDLFAFIVKMPMLHRIACFRDDIVFFIYLYQRWIYPVDKKRVNEFGQGGEGLEEETLAEEEKKEK